MSSDSAPPTRRCGDRRGTVVGRRLTVPVTPSIPLSGEFWSMRRSILGRSIDFPVALLGLPSGRSRFVLRRAKPGVLSATAGSSESDGPVWCVAANVVPERPYGPGGAEVRRRTNHFSPGAKVHVVDFFWGVGGERVTVVGRHRGAKRFVTLHMDADHLANWRAELVYSPHIIGEVLKAGELSRFSRGEPKQRARAEKISKVSIEQGAIAQPFVTRPPTASPMPQDEA